MHVGIAKEGNCLWKEIVLYHFLDHFLDTKIYIAMQASIYLQEARDFMAQFDNNKARKSNHVAVLTLIYWLI